MRVAARMRLRTRTRGHRADAVLAGLALAGVALCVVALSGCMGWHAGAMAGEPKSATYANVAGTRVRYVDTGPGAGPAVVLIHGFASSLEAWDAVIPTLAREHRVLALDLKGFGWTDRAPGDYTPAAQARLVLALMDQRGIDKAAVVGHSYGASVALAVALQAPERVTRLGLYSAWVYDEQQPTLHRWARAGGLGELLFKLYYKERPDEKLEQAFYDPELITEALAEAVERAMERPGTVAAALQTVRGMRYEDWQAKYRTVDVPVLLLWGREDVVTTLEFGERLLRELKDARLVVFPRCGHIPMIEAARESTRELMAFVAGDIASASAEKSPEAGTGTGTGTGTSSDADPDTATREQP